MTSLTALVTGSAGFIGRHFTAELQARGYDVRCVDLVHGADAFDVFRGDSSEHYDLVVHAAAQSPHRLAIDTMPEMHHYNQALDFAAFRWAARTGQGRLIYFSSCAALDVEPDEYGTTKAWGEKLAAQARLSGLPVTVVRPYSGYGEDQGEDWPFGAFTRRVARRDDPFIIWGNGAQERDWIHVSDLVNGTLAVAASGTTDPVSLCTGRGVTMLQLAQMLATAKGYLPRFEFRSDRPAGVSRRVGDPTELFRYYVNRTSLEQGVERAIRSAV